MRSSKSSRARTSHSSYAVAFACVFAIVAVATPRAEADVTRGQMRSYTRFLERYYQETVLPLVSEDGGARDTVTVFAVMSNASADMSERLLRDIGLRMGPLLPEAQVQFVTVVELTWVPGLLRWLADAEIQRKYNDTAAFYRRYYADLPAFEGRPNALNRYVDRTIFVYPEYEGRLPDGLREAVEGGCFIAILDPQGRATFSELATTTDDSVLIFAEIQEALRAEEENRR